MGARDTKSKQREKQTEPSQITELMGAMEREIQMLIDEMVEILDRPTSRYELYPRISATIRVYWYAKKRVLNPPFRGPFDPLKKLRSQVEQPRLEQMVCELDQVPRKDDEMTCRWWRGKFESLKQGIEDEFNESCTVLFPLLINECSQNDLKTLGSAFKSALKEPFPSLYQRERIGA